MTNSSRVEKAGKALRDSVAIFRAVAESALPEVPDARILDQLWRAYSRMELCVALLKLELSIDEEGRLQPKAKLEASLREGVLSSLGGAEAALKKLNEGRLGEALQEAKTSRGRVRSLLVTFVKKTIPPSPLRRETRR